MITFGLDLNLIPGKVLPRLNVSQYDKGQTVSVSLWNGDVPYSIPAGCTAQVVGTKADKTGFMYQCTIENGQPSFVITDQMTVFPGEVTLEVIIMDTDNRIGTVNFILDVEKAALADDTQISESDMPIIQQLPEIRAEVEAAAALAEAWAVGPGTEQEPSATNNAYYWAMQAASAAGGGLQPSVVQTLPTQDISTSTIYFVPSSDPSASNYYDEYINLDGTSQGWELIGTTAIDLTDYYTKGEVDALLATINGNVTTLDTQLKACSGQAAPYSTTKNYVPTDMVYYNDMLYQCIGAHTGAWDDLYFEPVDLSLLQTRYNNLNTHLTETDIAIDVGSISGSLAKYADNSYKRGNRVIIDCSIYSTSDNYTSNIIGKVPNTVIPSEDKTLVAVLRNQATNTTFPVHVTIDHTTGYIAIPAIGTNFKSGVIIGSYTI